MGAREHSLHNTWCKYKEIQTIRLIKPNEEP